MILVGVTDGPCTRRSQQHNILHFTGVVHVGLSMNHLKPSALDWKHTCLYATVIVGDPEEHQGNEYDNLTKHRLSLWCVRKAVRTRNLGITSPTMPACTSCNNCITPQ